MDFLKQLLDKGILEGSSILLAGVPGAGKTAFCQSLVDSFLKNNFNCLYVAVDRAPTEIRKEFGSFGTDICKMESEKKLVFVDGYGWLSGKSNETFRIESLANLTEFIIVIERASSYLGGRILLVFDSISPLPMHNPETDVIKFMQLLSARIRNWKGIGVYVMQAGIHSEKFCNTVAFLVDGIFEMKIEEERDGKINRYFRIRNLGFMVSPMTWTPFIIESGKGFKFQELEMPK